MSNFLVNYHVILGFSRWFFRSVDINADLLVQSLEPMRKKSCGGQNLFIITGEKVVLSFLKRLHRNDCNILVALPDGCSADLVPFASCVWHLSSLLNGKPPFLVRENMVPWRLVGYIIYTLALIFLELLA